MEKIRIKITGSGTPEEIISALQSVIDSITELENEKPPITWEDGTLLTVINNGG